MMVVGNDASPREIDMDHIWDVTAPNDIDPTTGLPTPFLDAVAPGFPPPPSRTLPPPTPPTPPTPPSPPSQGSQPRPARSGVRAGLVGGVVGALVAAGVAFATVKITEKDTKTATAPAAATSLGTTATTRAAGSEAPAPAAAGGTSPTMDIKAVLAHVGPSVVAIEIGQQSGGQVRPVAAGSGVVISSDGLILTNAHVVALTDASGRAINSPVVSVKAADGKLRDAKVLGTSPGNDVALVKVADTSGLSPVALGDSDAVEVGDPVLAIGNALDLGDAPTVTDGIISAKERTLQVDTNVTLTGLLQTDAPINHGNSGGALVNVRGELVGIPSAGIQNTNNLGFAIPINKAKPLLDQLKQGGTVTVTVTVLGVTTVEDTVGVTVQSVAAGSGAEKAGIQVGDIITSIDGKPVANQEAVGTAIKSHKPGDVIKVGLTRNGSAVEVTATLGSRQQ